MPMYKCPRCHTMSIPLKDKYRAGLWGVIHCEHCQAKLCAFPLLLAALYVIYAWDIAWFAGLYYFTKNFMDFIYMLIGWLMLDAFNVSFMPLAVMKGSPRY